MAQHTNDYVVGRGRVYFDPFDGNGDPTGEEYLGNTPGFSFSVASEQLEHFSAEGGIAERDDTVTTKITRAGTLQCDNMSERVLSLFVIGDIADLAQTGTSVSNEALTVQQGRYYQLGVEAGFPAGKRGLSNVVVTGTGGTPTYTLATDYEVDLDLGRLYIVPGGTIADDTDLEVDYDYATNSRVQIASASLTGTVGALRYIADNPKGTNRDWFMPKVELRPSGEFPLKSDPESPGYLVATFEVSVQTKATGVAQVYIEGRPA